MKQYKLTLRKIFVLLMMGIGISSCVSDSIVPDVPAQNQAEPMVALAVQVPSASIPMRTRSMSDAEEDAVKILQVLVFDTDGLKAVRLGALASGASQTESKLVFNVKLPKGEHDLIILANSQDIISQANLPIGISRDEAIQKLKKTMASPYKWGADLIPMWGAKYNLDINESLDLVGSENAIQLLRMLAKVDVELDPSLASSAGQSGTEAGVAATFQLSSVRLYNFYTQGFVIPQTDANGQMLPKTIHLASDFTKEKGPVVYEASDDQTGSYFTPEKLINTIYTFEAEAGSAGDYLKNTCLVLGGTYKGSNQPSYYRVDFVNRTSNNEYLDIRRNYNYTFKITDVKGPGFPTPEDAFTAGPTDMEITVILWDAGIMGDIVFDGQHFLGVDPTQIHHFADALSNQVVSIKTDYLKSLPEFKVSASATDPNKALAGGWLSLKPLDETSSTDLEVAGTEAKEYKLLYDIALNNTGKDRTAYIHIKLGRLNTVVAVTQTDEEELEVWLEVQKEDGSWVEAEDTEQFENTKQHLYFLQHEAGVGVEPQTYRVRWKPTTATIEFSSRAIEEKPISWEEGGELENPVPANGILKVGMEGVELDPENKYAYKEFKVKPQMISTYKKGSFEFLGQKLEIREVGQELVAKTLLFSQQVKDIVILSKGQLLDGKDDHSFTVKSNIPWSLFVTKNITDSEITSDAGIDKPVVKAVEGKEVNTDGFESSTEPVQVIADGTYNLPFGKRVKLETIDDFMEVVPTLYMGHLGLKAQEIQASNSTSPIYSTEQEILCASGIPQDGREANCYVLDPTVGVGIFIPVRAANFEFEDKYHRAGQSEMLYMPKQVEKEKVGIIENSNFGAKLIWTDVEPEVENKALDSDNLLAVVKAIPSSNYILVVPGTAQKEGNALVAVTNNDGETAWSWHIWLTSELKFKDNKPMQTRVVAKGKQLGASGAIWMDRNLGAIGKVDNPAQYGPRMIGNYYMWGKKDPIPGPKAFTFGTRDDRRPSYYKDGKGDLTTATVVNSSAKSIQEMIKTPEEIYTNTNNIWRVNLPANMWGGGTIAKRKSIFDPCPAGYRVPSKNDNERIWQTPTDADEYTKVWEQYVSTNLEQSHFLYAGNMIISSGGESSYDSNKKAYLFGTNTKTFGYWTATGGTLVSEVRPGYSLNTKNGNISISEEKQAVGMPVRCVLEDEEED